MVPLQIERGKCLPLGASALPDGVNFALLCRNGTGVTLVIYPLNEAESIAEIALHPRRNRTGDHWDVFRLAAAGRNGMDCTAITSAVSGAASQD